MCELTKNFKKYIAILPEKLTITINIHTLRSLTARMNRQISVF